MQVIENLVSFAQNVCDNGYGQSHEIVMCSELVVRAYQRLLQLNSTVRTQVLISACADLASACATEWLKKEGACKAQLSLCHPLLLFTLNKGVVNAS